MGVYRYVFAAAVDLPDVEATLLLAVLAAEALHGEAAVRLDAGHAFDATRRRCAIDATTAVGRSLNRLFAGFLRHEYGADAFSVERVAADPVAAAAS